ncbi:tyrosine-type recombinase/integrase [Magnetococcus sp. PR-3]|uniref:tyrosine-type recombinase/integrase n=1 Tax=Magnetococcus sp. PR-3 TaxID=3120355 RepID=UPI002FCE407E
MRITDKAIRAFIKQGNKQWLMEPEGFGVRFRSNAKGIPACSFVSRYQKDRKTVQITHGKYPALTLARARELHREIRGMLDRGEDPKKKRSESEAKQKAEESLCTFQIMAERYLETHGKKNLKPSTKKGYESHLKNHIYPKLGRLAPNDITRGDIHQLLDAMLDDGLTVAANRTLSTLKAILNWGLDRGYLEHSPVYRFKMPIREKRNQRYLNDEEIVKFWGSYWGHESVKYILRLVLLTSQRPGEVCQMTWSQIEREWWTIPADIAKNGIAHRVYLSPQALAVLRDVSAQKNRVYLFPALKNRSAYKTRTIGQIDQSVADRMVESNMQKWTPHALRKTGSTILSYLGYSDELIDKLQNHVSGRTNMSRTYVVRTFDKEIEMMLTDLGLYVEKLLQTQFESTVQSSS